MEKLTTYEKSSSFFKNVIRRGIVGSLKSKFGERERLDVENKVPK